MILVICAFVFVVVLGVSNTAFATSDFNFLIGGVSVDTAPVFTIAIIVITGLAAIWAIHKTIGLIRSR